MHKSNLLPSELEKVDDLKSYYPNIYSKLSVPIRAPFNIETLSKLYNVNKCVLESEIEFYKDNNWLTSDSVDINQFKMF